MGRSLIRGMLNSARGLSDKDVSPQAQAARRISGFADLGGLEFVARIDIGSDTNGEDKNEIRGAVTPDHKEYAQAMGRHSVPTGYAPSPTYAAPAAPISPTYAPPPVAPTASPPAPQATFPAAQSPQGTASDMRPTWAR